MNNIFAKIIYTTNESLKDLIIKRFNFKSEEIINNFEVYKKQQEDFNLVLIYSRDNDISSWIKYIKEKYEVINIFNIWTAFSLSDLDNKLWDVYMPNTLIDWSDKAIFLENYVDLNYDLNKFWLVMNWICYTKNDFENKEEIYSLNEEYLWELIDNEAYLIAFEIEKEGFISKFSVVKVLTNDYYLIENWVDILELMI